MSKRIRVAFCSSEVAPLAKTGGMADVCGALPVALRRADVDVSVFMPKYGRIGRRKGLTRIDETVSTVGLDDGIPVYLIDHDTYFRRRGLYGTPKGDYPDNLRRFGFFCTAVLQTIKRRRLAVDVIHCHDWQTALIPVYLKHALGRDPFFRKIRSVFSIHNLAYQGVFSKDQYALLNLKEKDPSRSGLEFFGKLSLLRGGLCASDRLTTVSPQYAREIQTRERGCGLGDVLRRRAGDLTGILNGLDYRIWDPRRDRHIAAVYDVGNPEGKAKNKRVLQETSGLTVRGDLPVFGFVGRLAQQKGIELIVAALQGRSSPDFQLTVLGTGDEAYGRQLTALQRRFPRHVAVDLTFDEKRAHQIYAGSDFFLMPSAYEPCGLSQMISMRYGTVPVVHWTGGLVDTVAPDGNGLVFREHSPKAFLKAVRRAVGLFHHRRRFENFRRRAFEARFTWEHSARAYKAIYRRCLKEAS